MTSVEKKGSSHARNVLAAIDASEQSWNALAFAVDMVKEKKGAKLHIIHVVPRLVMPVAGDMAPSSYIVMDREDELVEAGQKLIRKALSSARGKGLKDVEGKLEIGNPVDVILSEAKRTDADLIVLGNRGMGFKQGVLLGSVSERVAANSPVTVVVVKQRT